MKKILDARILDRLVERFKLRNLTGETFALSETVQPTTNIDEAAKEVRYSYFDATTSGTGNILLATVPDGERWEIEWARIVAISGTYTLTQWWTSDNYTASPAQFAYPDGSFTATADRYYTGKNFYVDEKEQIGAYLNAHTGAGTLRLIMKYRIIKWKK